MLLKNERSNPQLYCSKDNNKSTQLWLVYVKVNFKARFTVSLEVVGKINCNPARGNFVGFHRL